MYADSEEIPSSYVTAGVKAKNVTAEEIKDIRRIIHRQEAKVFFLKEELKKYQHSRSVLKREISTLKIRQTMLFGLLILTALFVGATMDKHNKQISQINNELDSITKQSIQHEQALGELDLMIPRLPKPKKGEISI